jgi:hypothetical protein
MLYILIAMLLIFNFFQSNSVFLYLTVYDHIITHSTVSIDIFLGLDIVIIQLDLRVCLQVLPFPFN